MGNESSKSSDDQETPAQRYRKLYKTLNKEVANLDLDVLCGIKGEEDRKLNTRSYASEYSHDDYSEEDSRAQYFDDDGTMDSSYYSRRTRDGDSGSALDQSEMSEVPKKRKSKKKSRNQSEDSASFISADDESKLKNSTDKNGVVTSTRQLSMPLASSFAKRCYFTKAGIGKTTQHYEGLTLTGNVVLMLAAAMKLKGCPTICDEDLRRVEQTYPNQFSRLPDELLLSSGWRRISKFCHFSNKAIPDGVPFFRKLKNNNNVVLVLA